MSQKKEFLRYVKLNFDLENKVTNLTQVEFKNCGHVNINYFLFTTLTTFEKILKPIAQKYDLKNDLKVIRDAITQCNNFIYDDEIRIIRDKLIEKEHIMVWWL